MPETIHCGNYDPSYEGCRECPGKVEVTQADGTVDTICRAGEKATREIATALNNLPVFPIKFPADEIPTIGEILPAVFDSLKKP